MREIRLSGSEGGGGSNALSLPLFVCRIPVGLRRAKKSRLSRRVMKKLLDFASPPHMRSKLLKHLGLATYLHQIRALPQDQLRLGHFPEKRANVAVQYTGSANQLGLCTRTTQTASGAPFGACPRLPLDFRKRLQVGVHARCQHTRRIFLLRSASRCWRHATRASGARGAGYGGN